jgi:hypothetical protein
VCHCRRSHTSTQPPTRYISQNASHALANTKEKNVCPISVASVGRRARDVRGISINDKFRANRPRAACARVWKGLFIIFVPAAAHMHMHSGTSRGETQGIENASTSALCFVTLGFPAQSNPLASLRSALENARAVRPAAHKYDISIVAGHVSKSVIVCVHRAATPNLGTRGEVASCAVQRLLSVPRRRRHAEKSTLGATRGDTTQQRASVFCWLRQLSKSVYARTFGMLLCSGGASQRRHDGCTLVPVAVEYGI